MLHLVIAGNRDMEVFKSWFLKQSLLFSNTYLFQAALYIYIYIHTENVLNILFFLHIHNIYFVYVIKLIVIELYFICLDYKLDLLPCLCQIPCPSCPLNGCRCNNVFLIDNSFFT